MTAQTWTVLEWDCQDGGLLGVVIVCVGCVGTGCEMCDGDGELFQPYRLPNGAAIDLWGDAEILIQIEPPSDDVPT